MWAITPHLMKQVIKYQAVTGNLHSQESLSQSLRSLAYPRLCSLTIVTCMVYCLPLPAWNTKKRSDLLHIWILLLIFPGKMSSHSCCVTMTEAMCCLEAVANT